MTDKQDYRPFTAEQSVPGPLNQEAIITRLISRVHTATIVQVVAVSGGGTGPVGFVDVVNLVQQIDANNDGIPNKTIYKLPYFRLQGGSNAVIIDPQVGDLGLAVFAMRDITDVKNTKKEGKPLSRREYDPSDGLYIGGFLNGAPNQYVHFMSGGIHIVSTGEVTMDCTKLRVNAPIEATGDITDTVDGSGKSMAAMRGVYNSHNHQGDSGGITSTPNQDM